LQDLLFVEFIVGPLNEDFFDVEIIDYLTSLFTDAILIRD
jgi:hypothetical protein